MVAFDVFDFQKNVTGNIELDDSVFSTPVNDVFLHQVLVSYKANLHQGTHKVLWRSEISGTRKKPFRQKGTGRARQGFCRASHYRGGYTQFGPHPRSYRKTITKKMKREAFRQCLSLKADHGQFFILTNLDFPEIKTKQASEILKKFATNGRVLFLDVNLQNTALLSIRNLRDASVLSVNFCSPLDIFESDSLFLTQAAAQLLQERYANAGGLRHEE